MLTMRSPGLDAGRGRRRCRLRPRRRPARDDLVERHVGAAHQHDREHDKREQQIHDRSGQIDLEPHPLALRQELVGRAGALVLDGLAGELHVSAERHDADAVLGAAARELQDLRTEAEREREDPHAVRAGHQEMPELVDEHEHAEDEQKRENCDHRHLLAEAPPLNY